ncbi:MAG: hypothetical protein NTZ79_03270, partial [Proteobacteria bacterium]|nr:hypothetical protein [Pseudomonadota bacterium]
NGDLHSYGRGLFSDTYRGLRRIHHGGAWAGYRAMLMRFPDQALSIGITCNVNTADTEARADQVADVVLAGAFHEPKRAVPEVGASTAAGFDATPYLGTFFSGDAGAALSVAVVERKPVLEMYRMKFPLALITADRLTAPQADLTLEFDAARNLVKVTDEFHVVGTFHRIVRVAPAVSDLRELVGSYRSVELGVTWTVRVEAGKVFVKGRAVGESELSPVMADAFESDQFFYSFSRDAAGQINGFDLSAGRMHNIRFDR